MFAIVALFVKDGMAHIYKITPEAGAGASKTREVIFPSPRGATRPSGVPEGVVDCAQRVLHIRVKLLTDTAQGGADIRTQR